MRPEIKKFLLEILESIEAIEDYLGDKKDFTVFMNNKMMRRAVERELEIIGEATRKPESVEPNLPISHKSKTTSFSAYLQISIWLISLYESLHRNNRFTSKEWPY